MTKAIKWIIRPKVLSLQVYYELVRFEGDKEDIMGTFMKYEAAEHLLSDIRKGIVRQAQRSEE